MFVLTVDRQGSRAARQHLDMGEQRATLQRALPQPALAWAVSAGDELQALYEDPAGALQAVLALADTRAWHIGVGVGRVDLPLAGDVRESTGDAFVAAREAVAASKDSGAPTVRGGPWAERTSAVLAFVCAVRLRRTPAGVEAAELADTGMTQQQISERLGITQSSVSRRLGAALWQQEHETRQALVALLELADNDAVAARSASAHTPTEEPQP